MNHSFVEVSSSLVAKIIIFSDIELHYPIFIISKQIIMLCSRNRTTIASLAKSNLQLSIFSPCHIKF